MTNPGTEGFSQKRIHKEMSTMSKSPPPGTKLCVDRLEATGEFVVELIGAKGTLYCGEQFKLLFKFGERYPFESPQVMFIDNIPIHPHIYSNGHICLSILTEDWSPALSVEAICLSVISMLSSCTQKKRPPDNALYVRTCSKNPKDAKWWFHDGTGGDRVFKLDFDCVEVSVHGNGTYDNFHCFSRTALDRQLWQRPSMTLKIPRSPTVPHDVFVVLDDKV